MRSVLRPVRECIDCWPSVGTWSLLWQESVVSFHWSRRNQSSVAVVGTGPAGLYFVDRLKRLVPDSVRIDLFERLPTPFGLVRSGVAPDHPDTKNVTNKFTSVCSSDGVRFLGNVAVGADVSVPELQQHYSAVVLAHGADDDKRLGIDNESCKGVLSAREFVNWYNGHPMYVGVDVPHLKDVESVGIIGLGNVALDCARILLRPVKDLRKTDIADHALSELSSSVVKNVHIIGRRGPFQAQFSAKEVKEVLHLPNISINVYPDDYWPTDTDMGEPRRAQKVAKEIMAADGKTSTKQPERNLHLHFLENPSQILIDGGSGCINGLEVDKQMNSFDDCGRQVQMLTGEKKTIPLQLLLKSVGYRGQSMEGVPFNEAQGIIPNQMGRVTDASGKIMPGLYVAGWIKRGPSGVIGSNVIDAQQTAQCVQEDLQDLSTCKPCHDIQKVLEVGFSIYFQTFAGAGLGAVVATPGSRTGVICLRTDAADMRVRCRIVGCKW